MLRFCILVSFLAIGIGERYVALQDIFADYGVAAYALPRVKPRATGGPLYESFGIPWRFDVSNG
jgi:hypothetical protein